MHLLTACIPAVLGMWQPIHIIRWWPKSSKFSAMGVVDVQVLSRYGESIRTFGGRGTTGGKFSLPFDVAAFSHPTMGQCYVVTEFENNRVQVSSERYSNLCNIE